MSHVKTDKLSARTASGTITLGESGETFSLPSGTTLNIASGATISNAGTASGFGKVLQYVISTYTTQTSTTSTIPIDGSIPQNTEGVEILTATITPTSASSKLLIEFDAPFNGGNTGMGNVFALFQDSDADAIVAASVSIMSSTVTMPMMLRHYMTSGTTSATTFKIRWGVTSATGYINRWDTGTVFGAGTSETILKVTELAV